MWTPVACADGRTYYWNEATDETRWSFEDEIQRSSEDDDGGKELYAGSEPAREKTPAKPLVRIAGASCIVVKSRLFTRGCERAPVKLSLVVAPQNRVLDRVWLQLQEHRVAERALHRVVQQNALRSLVVSRFLRALGVAFHLWARWHSPALMHPPPPSSRLQSFCIEWMCEHLQRRRVASLTKLLRLMEANAIQTRFSDWRAIASPDSTTVVELHQLTHRMFNLYQTAHDILFGVIDGLHARLHDALMDACRGNILLRQEQQRTRDLVDENEHLVHQLSMAKVYRAQEQYDALRMRQHITAGKSRRGFSLTLRNELRVPGMGHVGRH